MSFAWMSIFEPNVDPVELLTAQYGGRVEPPTLRLNYQKAYGSGFSHPMLEMQRPTGRFEEGPLFASAENRLSLFQEKVLEGLKRSGSDPCDEIQMHLDQAEERRLSFSFLRRFYFNFPESRKDSRNTFNGSMTKDTYTKAAHLHCLLEMLPPGKITLVSEQEAAMARVVPHIFRKEIQNDRFEWLAVHFDKKATKGEIVSRTSSYDRAFRRFREANPELHPWDALHAWAEQRLRPAVRQGKNGKVSSYPISNYAAFPALWLS